MKKLLGLAIAGALLASALPVKAELLKNLKTKGELEILGVMNHNVRDALTTTGDNYRNTKTKLTWGMGFDLLDNLHSNITFTKDNRYYGAQTAGQRGEVIDTLTAQIHVDEANIVLDNLFEKFNAKIGRQYYGKEGGMVVYYGPYHRFEGTSVTEGGIDAMRFDLTGHENLMATAIWGKITETSATQDLDTSMYGLTADYKLMEKTNVGGYLYNRRVGNNTYNLTNDELYVIGLKADTEVMGLKADGEFAFNRGHHTGIANQKTPGYVGYGFLANASYKLDAGAAGGFNPRFMFAYGSGDDYTYNSGAAATSDKDYDKHFYGVNPDFRPGEIFGNSAGNFYGIINGLEYTQQSLDNLTVMNLGVDYTNEKFSKLTSRLDYYTFRLNTVPTGVANKGLGTEVDLRFDYAYAENVTLALALAKFMPGGRIKECQEASLLGNDPMSKVAAYVSVKF